jgi:hypothetical protein
VIGASLIKSLFTPFRRIQQPQHQTGEVLPFLAIPCKYPKKKRAKVAGLAAPRVFLGKDHSNAIARAINNHSQPLR